MRLIDADALRQEVERIFMKHFAKSKEKFVQDTFKALFKRIDSAPTIEARPVVRGEWVVKDGRIHCSRCDATRNSMRGYELMVCDGEKWVSTEKTNFCPNCGADMRGEEDG